MDNGEWDLMSIVHSCKATTFTNPTIIFETSLSPQTPITITTTNNVIPTQNTTPSYINDFTIIQENNSVPVTPLKPTDFIDLEKLRINFNHNNTLPIPTTIIPNLTTSSPISATTTPTSSTTNIPTYITTTPFDNVHNHPSVPQQPLRQHNQLPIVLPQTPITITTNNIIPPQNTVPSYFNDYIVIQENNSVPIFPFKPTNFIDLETTAPYHQPHHLFPQVCHHYSHLVDYQYPHRTITTTPFDNAYNHPSVPEQPLRQHSQLPIALPQIPITTTTNNVIPTQNTTPSYFNDLTIIQENNPVPITPLKPTDFIDLEKLKINFNHNNTPMPTTIIPNPTTSSLISATTTPTSSTTNIPTYITTAPFDNAYNHPSVPEQPLRQHNQLPIALPQTPITITTNNIIPLQNTIPSYFNDFTVIQENNSVPIFPFKPTNFIDLEKFRFNFNPLQIPTTLIPNSTTIMTPTIINAPTTSIPTIIPTTTTTTFSPISATTIPASPTSTILTHIPTAHFGRACNHSLVQQQPLRQHNQLPNVQPRTCSRVLPNIYPQQSKCKSRKRKNYNQVSLVCQVKKENLLEDRWIWRKYGQKSLKQSPHPRNYYRCSTKDCLARKVVEKSKTIENTYVVTYIGVHNHEKPSVSVWNSRRLSYKASQSSQME